MSDPSIGQHEGPKDHSRLLAPLRLSAADPPKRRRRVALEHLEANGFSTGVWESAAVLAAFGRESDPALREARYHIRLIETREAAAELAENFFGLSRGERKAVVKKLAEEAPKGSALQDDINDMARLAAAKIPSTPAMPVARAALKLAALPLPDRAQEAASLAVREQPHGTGIPPAVLSRSGLPPHFLVPPEVVGGAPPKAAATSPKRWFRLTPSADPSRRKPTPWRLTLVCLFCVYLAINLVIVVADLTAKPSTPTSTVDVRRSPDVTTAPADLSGRFAEWAESRITGPMPPAFQPADPTLTLSTGSTGLRIEKARPDLADPVNGYDPGWLNTLAPKTRETLVWMHMLAAVDGDRLASVAEKRSVGIRNWVNGEPLPQGYFAPGIQAADLPAVFAALQSVRVSGNPSPERLHAIEDWLTNLAAGVPVRPPSEESPADE